MMKTFVATRGGVTDVAPVTEQAAYLAASEVRVLVNWFILAAVFAYELFGKAAT